MAQKKSESVQATVDNIIPAEELKSENVLVDTLWNQYEHSLERARQLRETRENAYINALKEVIKFNKQYRKSLANLYDQAKKTNKEVVTELVQELNVRREDMMKEEAKAEAELLGERDELKAQLKEVSKQLETIAITPVKSVFQIIDQLEDNFEKNTEANIAYARQRRNAWQQVTNEYVKIARKAHNEIVNRTTNSVKVLVKS
jgi:Polyhydroxyalkanoic acid inclusion protein (PhaP_Bmeg)